ncbi:MAG: universal stress protein [Hyphomicrobiales bacterium]|nr:universal stress protein [Hyphomicrobiales bacterium]
MYRNILISTDGSDLAGKAVEHGVGLAKDLDAAVTFVTVTEMWSALDMAAEVEHGTLNPLEVYEEMAAKAAEKILTAAKAAARKAGVKCETLHVRDRPPAEGIIATAEEKGCDLIVMASHGRRGLNRILLGSQTTEVLAYTKVPVLVVR